MVSPELMTGLGAAFSIFLASAGSAVASAQAGIFALRYAGPKAFIPIIISGVLAIYGIIISVILSGRFAEAKNDGSSMSEADGYKYLSSGLAVGLACLSSGCGMASFIAKHMEQFGHNLKQRMAASGNSDQAQRLLDDGITQDVAPDWKFILVMVFIEAIGLYGLIVALILAN